MMIIKFETEQELTVELKGEKLPQKHPNLLIEVESGEIVKNDKPKIVKIEFIPRKTKIKCEYCNRKYKTKNNYNKHLKDHKVDGKLPKIVPIKSLKHKKSSENNFSCDLCGKQWQTKQQIVSHIKTGHMFFSECPICNKKLRYGGYNLHLISHMTEKNFKCKVCDKKFKAPNDVKTHLKTHNKQFECRTCGNKFAKKKSLINHEQIHQKKDSTVLECKFCGMRFKYLNHLNRHQKNHKEKSTKSLKCLRCNFSTDNKRNFLKHQKNHELKDKKAAQIKNPINCEKCPAVLRNKQALRCHMINCHPIAPYECDLCGRVINARTNFIKHINYHLNMKKLQVD
ncbi:unnamed protein product [Chironomus riparius]|uniref:C2H2-type domain-containing protein n=1 Tax=Chironomus riparius TaxID=315576 RepID=A0A9N9S3M0_9DIPT|nr:unnamed protein product [Chironomus riparius]